MISNPIISLEQDIKLLQSQVESLKRLLLDFLQARQSENVPSKNHATGIDLAMQVTGLAKGTIYNLVAARKIPHYKKNGRIFFFREELQDWIREGKRKSLDELSCG
jgi:predicted DNA-binding transcriptional regulator AlpA